MARIVAFSLAVLILGLNPTDAHAATLKGHALPDRIESDGEMLVLNGLALKEVTVFGIDVYLVGLYLTRPTGSWKEIVESPGVKMVRFRFTRAVKRATLVESWVDDLRESCGEKCSGLFGRVRAAAAFLPDIRVGQEMDYVFSQSGVRILIDGNDLVSLTEPADARVILAALIGEDAPSQKLRRDLLGATKGN